MREFVLLGLVVVGSITMIHAASSRSLAQDTAVAEPATTEDEVAKDVATATTPAPRDLPWWKDRHESMNKRAAEEKWDLVFMGDSITQGWEGAGKKVWAEHYGDRKAGNLGISGDETEHLAWRLENGNLKGQSPKVAVIMIGTNNLGNAKHSPQAVVAGITEVVKRVRELSPDTEVLLLGVFPRGEKSDNPYRAQIKEVNQGIQKLADDKDERIHYLDIAESFLEEDGSLSKQVMPDFLHLSPEGYKRWAKAIEPTLEKLLKKAEAPDTAS